SKETSRIIKLNDEANEVDYLSVLGALNSSTACLWIKQVCFPKGGDHVGQEGARVRRTLWDERFNFNATSVDRLPLPDELPLAYSRLLDALGHKRDAVSPKSISQKSVPSSDALECAHATSQAILGRMIAFQEELDWECYRLYGLVEDDLTVQEAPPLKLGQRAFEIVLARKMVSGEVETAWFERHGSTPIIEIPAEWPGGYKELVERRIEIIETNPHIALIEQPEYKRRWNTEPWESQLERALREWLLDRLESHFDFDGRMNDADQPTAKVDIALVSVAKLADIARQDAEFLQVSELYRDDPAFDVQALVGELVAAECVPLLPVLRYKPSGFIKRGTWERTWDLQRQEDAIDARTKLPSTDPDHLSEDTARDLKQKKVGNIPVPTKYESKDCLDSNFWRLRGKLDVPKERWISFPHCEGPDGTPVIAWAGYDHLQQARAISAYYVRVQTEFGGTDDPRLIPLLACLIELLPWLKQWHNEPDAAFDGMRMGDYFEGFVTEEARRLNKTLSEIKAWPPPPRISGRGRRRAGT
ncbi:MAG: BREX-2 system adenine-specific DNA-methyltransferase PglX, partial [Planctomycetaceae bacterium]|nr:BREX-2 system adenine-specific DNA-methyltransferase PglX [Planctomycetaceae bacterium]